MTETTKGVNLISVKSIIICMLLLIATCFSCQNIRIGEIVSIVEAGIVIVLAVTRRLDYAIIFHNVFLACSIEVSSFVYSEYTMMYSYAYLPYVHRYGPLAIGIGLLMMLAISQNGKIRIKRIIGKKRWMNQFALYITLLVLIGFIVSLFMYLINDNGINSLSWYKDSYFREATYWLILIIDVYLIYNRIDNNQQFAELLRKCLINLFLAVPIASILSIILGFHGNYSYHTTVLLMPLISFYTVGVAVFPTYRDYKSIIYLVGAALMLAAQVIFTTPLLGKWILFIIAAVLVILWNTLSRKRFLTFIGIALLIIIAVVIFGNTIISSSEILKYKFEQAMGIFKLSGTWLNSMSSSPSVRIEELINVGVEYSHKPLFALFGKGIGGTTLHWLNWNNWNITSAFTVEQFSSGVFIGMHESVNIIFLKFGIVGVIFFIWMVVKSVKNVSKSPWVFLGLFWFVFFINAYISLYVMIPVFMLGMYESEKIAGD